MAKKACLKLPKQHNLREGECGVCSSVDLSVEFCGLKFSNPFLLSSAPPTAWGEGIMRAFAQGWGGAVTKTIGPEGMPVEDVKPRFSVLRSHRGDIIGFENFELISKRPLKQWLQEIREIKAKFPAQILIASIMAPMVREEWQKLALAVQEAGADALELNLSCPHGMPEQGMGAAIGQDPAFTQQVTGWVKEVVRIPVLVKLTPNVTDILVTARAAQVGGADGITAINTVQCLSGIDLDTFEPQPAVSGMTAYGGYSGLAIKPIGLRCVSQIAANVDLPVSGSGGISAWSHALEYLLVGASTVQVCTEVMLRGYGIIKDMLQGMEWYLASKGIYKLDDIIGKALPRITRHEELSREYRVVAEMEQANCTGCGRCVTACLDAGYSALAIDSTGKAAVNPNLCDGCSLCTHVCDKLRMVKQQVQIQEEKLAIVGK